MSELRWLTNQSKGNLYHSDVVLRFGRPKATAVYTVEELERQGMEGVYTTGATRNVRSTAMPPQQRWPLRQSTR